MADSSLNRKIETKEIKYLTVPPLEKESFEYVIPAIAYYNLVSAIPRGMVCSYDDIMTCLNKAYGKDSLEIQRDRNAVELYVNESFPYWRVVSQRGYLIDNIYCSSESQKEKLETDGIKVNQIGEKHSYRVDDFEHCRFDVSICRITVIKTDEELLEQYQKAKDATKD